jgi:hypothetical protein
MCHSDQDVSLGVLECVVIAVHAIKLPSVLLQHPDQLAAISFHGPPPKQHQDNAVDQAGTIALPIAGPKLP